MYQKKREMEWRSVSLSQPPWARCQFSTTAVLILQSMSANKESKERERKREKNGLRFWKL